MFGWCILALWLATVIPVTVAVEGTVASLRGPQSKAAVPLSRELDEDDDVTLYYWRGCFNDDEEYRVLPDYPLVSDNMTIPFCYQHCDAYNAAYMGLQFGNECWCGIDGNTDHEMYGGDAVCDMKCTGVDYSSATSSGELARNATCGGYLTFSLYQLAWADPVDNGEYTGCFRDDIDDRVLANMITSDNMTVGTCKEHCLYDVAGAWYYGLQYGSECWCGMTSEAVEYEDKGLGVCHTLCSGDPEHSCGGYEAFDLYKLTEVHNASEGLSQTSFITSNDDELVVNAIYSDDDTSSSSTTDDDDDDEPPYYWRGCFNDSEEDRVLPDYPFDSENMTIQLCYEHCVSYNSAYMGLQSGDECWCGLDGNTDHEIYTADDAVCNIQCAGVDDSDATSSGYLLRNATCGGVLTFSLYQLEWADPVDNGEYAGCFKDDIDDRVLDNMITSDDMTVAKCKAHCLDDVDGAWYYGLQYGSECWCGMTSEAIEYEDNGPGVCHILCSGDPEHSCGGYEAFDLYKLTEVFDDAVGLSTTTTGGASDEETVESFTGDDSSP